MDTKPNLIQLKVLLLSAKKKFMKIQETIFIFFTKHFLKITLQLVEKENIYRNAQIQKYTQSEIYTRLVKGLLKLIFTFYPKLRR